MKVLLPPRAPGVTLRRVGDTCLLYDGKVPTVRELSGLAFEVWSCAGDPASSVDRVAAQLGLDSAAVESAVTDLVALGVLAAVGGFSRRALLGRGAVAGGGLLLAVVALPSAAAAASGSGVSPTGPQITSLSPGSGAGNNAAAKVTIFGSGLTGTNAVAFGDRAASQITVISDTQLTVIAPENAPGAVNVVVTTPTGSSTLVNGYTFTRTK